MPVGPFVALLRPAPPVNTKDGFATALQRIRRAPALSYLGHSPRVRRLKHLDDYPGTGHHSGSRTPSPVSSNRHRIGHVA